MPASVRPAGRSCRRTSGQRGVNHGSIRPREKPPSGRRRGHWPPDSFASTMTTATRRWAIDAALAALVTGVQLAVALAPLRWNGHAESQPGSFGIILLIIAGAALVARRRFPGAVLGVVLAATLGAKALGAQYVWLALIVAFCTAVLRGRRWPAIASL